MEAVPRMAAKTMAWRGVTWPVGRGRVRVRFMRESTCCSTSWLMAAAELAARPMPRVPSSSTSRGTIPGVARNMPTMAVKTMSITTRGLHSS